MFKLLATASVPLVLALAKVFGYDLQEKEALEVADALNVVIGAAGTVIAVLIPSIKAKLKFGEDAK